MISKLKKIRPKKELFWIWIGYHCIKGILTLSFIWIPLILLWLKQ